VGRFHVDAQPGSPEVADELAAQRLERARV